MKRQRFDLLEVNKNSQIEILGFLYVKQSVVLGQYINILPLKYLSILHYKSEQFYVDFSELDQTNLTLITLWIQNYNIKALTELQKFYALQNLILEGTDFKDFGVLKSLKLSYLQLNNNQMSFQDKRTICQLTSLYQLHLDNCGFREVHLLQELTQLRELTLKNNSLTNLDFVDCEFRLLQKLDVSYNLLVSLDFLTALSPCLIELNASHNKIGKLFYSDEHDVINIEILNLSYNKLFDINQLTRFTNLKELNLQSNKLGEKRVKVLKQLQIQSLNLTNIQCRTLNCLHTNSVTKVIMNSYIQNYNTLNLFNCQYLEQFSTNSDKISNKQLTQLKIIRNYIQINPPRTQYNNRHLQMLSIVQDSLLYYLKTKTGSSQLDYFLKVVFRSNFQKAILIILINWKFTNHENYQNIYYFYLAIVKQLVYTYLLRLDVLLDCCC
ncbi:tandem-95_repeat protein [Hexamita inflata]|uniref:Tandem-95 repeat protein n=1 Tax=Hexamita inflata TaxID=28002 RepID=A0AA86V1L3_9EUKA|nr:tandem-95 repeat protein [Hexamita inflata]